MNTYNNINVAVSMIHISHSNSMSRSLKLSEEAEYNIIIRTGIRCCKQLWVLNNFAVKLLHIKMFIRNTSNHWIRSSQI